MTYLAKELGLRRWLNDLGGAEGRVPLELRMDAVVGEHAWLIGWSG